MALQSCIKTSPQSKRQKAKDQKEISCSWDQIVKNIESSSIKWSENHRFQTTKIKRQTIGRHGQINRQDLTFLDQGRRIRKKISQKKTKRRVMIFNWINLSNTTSKCETNLKLNINHSRIKLSLGSPLCYERSELLEKR